MCLGHEQGRITCIDPLKSTPHASLSRVVLKGLYLCRGQKTFKENLFGNEITNRPWLAIFVSSAVALLLLRASFLFLQTSPCECTCLIIRLCLSDFRSSNWNQIRHHHKHISKYGFVRPIRYKCSRPPAQHWSNRGCSEYRARRIFFLC